MTVDAEMPEGLPANFVEQLAFVHPKEIIEQLKADHETKAEDRKSGTRWVFRNEVRPVDIYCYFGARFGQPNGFQSFLRADHSDNLIHWEWHLRHEKGFVTVQGHNFRTEVWITGYGVLRDDEKLEFIKQLKDQFSQNGKELSRVRKALEHWIEFVNPYQRLRTSIKSLSTELDSLGLDQERDKVPDMSEEQDVDTFTKRWKEQAEKYTRAIGLSFGIRAMLPVMAEAFVNLLLYVLMKPEIRKDERLRESATRQPIDIRIRSLSHTCLGFKQAVDYENDACKKYHSLVNERNDLLHGNLVIDKLKFNELYFFGTVPVFIKYRSMWERSVGVGHQAVGTDKVKDELGVVDDLVKYLLSCLDDELRERVEYLTERFQLGLCLDNNQVSVLFPDHLVDLAPFVKPDATAPSTEAPT